jgi:hypothetical protein
LRTAADENSDWSAAPAPTLRFSSISSIELWIGEGDFFADRGGILMSCSLRASRCALAFVFAVLAYPHAMLGQGSWLGRQYPVRMAQATAPAMQSEQMPDGQGSMSPNAGPAGPSGSVFSDDAGDSAAPGYEFGPNGYCGGCDNGCYGGCCQPYGCDNACDCNPGCYGGACQSCTRCSTRCCFFADELYLQVTGADVTHAQQQNGIGGAGTVPFGDIGTIDLPFDSGIRVGGSVCCGPCSSFICSYSFFETDNQDSLDAPILAAQAGAVGSLVQHPGTALTASAGPVLADYNIQFQSGDALFRTELVCGKCYTANFLLGAQVGHLEQDFHQSGVFGSGLGGVVDTTTNIRFDGGGLKGGFDFNRQLCCCFSLYGRFTAAAMQGAFQSHYTMLNQTGQVLLADAVWTDHRIVPQLEYEAGFRWCKPNCHWNCSAGYMVSQWLNTVTTPEFIDAVQHDRYVNVGDSITFAGLVARVGCCW